MVIAPINR